MKIIEAHHLTKLYQNIAAVRDVSFSVCEGDIYGICGNRGAGKTTLLRLLAGSIPPCSGRIFLYNQPAGHSSAGQRLGINSDQTEILHHLSGVSHLLHFSNKTANEARCLEMLRAVGLGDAAYVKVGKYSEDMIKRLLLAQTAVQDPDVLLLDEPASGLESTSIRYICHFIEVLKQQGKTVIMTFDKLDDLADLCTTISIMQNGRMMKTGSKEELYAAYGHSIKAAFKLSHVTEKEKQTLIPLISQFADILSWTKNELTISIRYKYYIPVVVRALVNQRIDLFRITVDEPELNDLLYGSEST